MSPKTVAAHVGAHKTGTSLVQKYMLHNQDVLARERIGRIGRDELNDLVGWGDKLRKHPERLAAAVEAGVADPGVDTLIMSNENTIGHPLVPGGGQLYPEAAPVVDALKTVLQPYPTKIVLSIRPQNEFLESYYLQLIHQGEHPTFDEWLDTVDLDAVSWQPLVRTLVDAFGAEHVVVLDFRRIREGQESYLHYFFTSVDPGLTFDIRYGAIRNPSISEKGLRMALAANPHLADTEYRVLLRKFLQKHFSNTRYPRPVLFSDEQKAWLRQRYDAEYEQLVGVPAAEGAR